MRRRWAGLIVALVVALAVAVTAGCAGDEATPLEATSPSTPPAPTGVQPVVVTTTTSGAPPPTASPRRSVALGETFRIAVEESVTITGEALTATYTALVADSRCPLDVQCITAGDAAISVTLTKAGSPPLALELHTTEGPMSGRYASYTIELVQLPRGSSPIALLLIT